MKAIVRETYRAPDVLHLKDVPLPTLGDREVLIKVRADDSSHRSSRSGHARGKVVVAF